MVIIKGIVGQPPTRRHLTDWGDAAASMQWLLLLLVLLVVVPLALEQLTITVMRSSISTARQTRAGRGRLKRSAFARAKRAQCRIWRATAL